MFFLGGSDVFGVLLGRFGDGGRVGSVGSCGGRFGFVILFFDY